MNFIPANRNFAGARTNVIELERAAREVFLSGARDGSMLAALLAFALCAVAARADAAGDIPPAAPVEDAARRVA